MRSKCKTCGDKIFKLVNGQILCRKNHVYELEAGAKE